MKYVFPKENLRIVTDHLDSLDIEVQSMTLNGNLYSVETTTPVPEEQLEHLEMVET